MSGTGLGRMLDDREFGLLFLEGATNFTFSEASRQFLGHKYFFYPTRRGDISSKLNVAGT